MGTKDDYISSIKDLFVRVGKTVAMTFLIGEIPILGAPIIRQVVGYIIEKALIAITNSTELGVYFVHVDFRINEQGRDFIAIALKNKQIQQSGTKEEREKSEKETMESFLKFVRISS